MTKTSLRKPEIGKQRHTLRHPSPIACCAACGKPWIEHRGAQPLYAALQTALETLRQIATGGGNVKTLRTNARACVDFLETQLDPCNPFSRFTAHTIGGNATATKVLESLFEKLGTKFKTIHVCKATGRQAKKFS